MSEGGASSGGGTLPCGACAIPMSNLVISWVNALSGNGSDTLTYIGGGSSTWQTGCSGAGGQNIFKMFCTDGLIELRVYYFTSGSCPGGGSAYCSNVLASPRALALSSFRLLAI